MKLQEILGRKGHDVVTIGRRRTVLEAARSLVEHGIGSLIVTEGDGLVGIITERDILRLSARAPDELAKQEVATAMTRDPITAAPDADLQTMMGVMTERRIRHLPVLEGERLVGIVSIGDLLNACRVEAEEENSQLRRYIHGHA